MVYDTIFSEIKIDTTKIVAEFLKRKYYEQVFVDDSTGYIQLKQTVELNKIVEQELMYVPPVRSIIYMQTKYEKKFRYSVGAEYLFSSEKQDMNFKGGVLFQNKYHFNVGYSTGNMKSIGFNYIF